MKLLYQLFSFYINSSIHIALAVCAFLKITQLYLDLPYNSQLLFFVFFATITGYNFVKYVGIAKLYHRSLTKNLKVIQVFSLICFVLTCYFGLQLKLSTLLFIIPFVFLTVLYAIPFYGFDKNLRNVSSIKNVIISLVWAGVTVLLPVFDANQSVDTKEVLLCVQRLLFVAVLILPFDIRDVNFDKQELQTLPQLIGVKKTKKVGFILLTVTLFLEFFITPNQSSKTVFLFIFLFTLMLVQRASIQQKKYYASFWVEAIPVFWLILLLFMA